MGTQRFTDIMERVEQVRRLLRLNKSVFAKGFGMKPQTYSNFVGPQGTKPSVELIAGIVRTYHVSPQWLLNGNGEVFLGEDAPILVSRSALSSASLLGLDRAGLDGILDDVQALSEVVEAIGSTLSDDVLARIPPLSQSIQHLTRHFVAQPRETCVAVSKMLDTLKHLVESERALLEHPPREQAS